LAITSFVTFSGFYILTVYWYYLIVRGGFKTLGCIQPTSRSQIVQNEK